MPNLRDEIKVFIVKGLACFDTPSEVVEAVKANFGLQLSRQHVYAYDPRCAQPPAQRWRDLYATTRAEFLSDATEIGITQKVYRLRVLDRLVRRAEVRGKYSDAAAFLEQAAKECAGAYESRKSVTSAVRAPALTGPTLSAPETPSALAPVAK